MAPTSRRSARLSSMKKSSDDAGIIAAGTTRPPPRRSSGRFLQEVAIPHHNTLQGTSKASTTASIQGSVSTVSGNRTRDSSVGVDTPDTSLITTPAEPSGSNGNLVQTNKRKRTTRSSIATGGRIPIDTSTDAELALRLQEEEYNARVNNAAGASSSRRKEDIQLIPDTEGSDTEDSDVVPLARKGKRTKVLAAFVKSAKKAGERSRATRNKQSTQSARQHVSDDDSDDDELSSPVSSFSDSEAFLSSLEESDNDESSDQGAATQTTTQAILSQLSATMNSDEVRRAIAERRAIRQRRVEELMAARRKRRRQKLEEAHPEIRTMWDDLGKVPIIAPEQAQQPASITRKLKPFQLEGLAWMIKQEKTHYKGGLLGDEMGMGKTIQSVALMMSDHPAQDPTLVVVPPVALMQWANEIREYTSGQLKVLVYHGSNAKSKNLTKADLRKYDVIMISYNSLESLHRKETKGWSRGDELVKEDSVMHNIKFHRIILDEAHNIKQRTTGVAKACFALQGTYKWCLSGTPVQNRIGEFFSLLRFLEVRPFADYFCEKCPCAQLHWKLTEDYMCASCGHSGAEHVSVFNRELLNPITGDSDTLRQEALDKLRMITARVMLRRLKKDNTASMELPPKEVIIHNEFFGEIERDFSKSIMTNSSRTFDRYVSRGVMLNNYANIFGLIMQMRQVANHPDLILKKHAEVGQNVLVCNICDEPAEDAVRSACKHEFCRTCLKTYVQSSEGSGQAAVECPRCHIVLSIDWEQPEIIQDEELVKKNSIINRIKMEDWTSSTKIEMLIYELYKLRSKKQTLKSIVFSQFTSMLQLVEWRLRRAGFNTVMLDGSMTPIQRQRSIDYFMKNVDVEVFLVSLKAGGVALNLTEASRVFIVDPWWNPAAEWQSADRCHRIGQRRPCVITRLVIEDSVESRMVMLQEKKARMISGTINNDKVAMEKLSPEDLQFLFRGS